MTLALLAQAALHQLRQRLGEPAVHWRAFHLAKSLFAGMDGEIRVHGDTIGVTFKTRPRPENFGPIMKICPPNWKPKGSNQRK
jgi:hypothetical protein